MPVLLFSRRIFPIGLEGGSPRDSIIFDKYDKFLAAVNTKEKSF